MQTDRNGTSYLYENGQKVTGLKTFDGVTYYFYDDGRQAKGTEVTINNNVYQFDQLTGIMTRNAFSKSYNYEGSPRFPYYPTRYYGNDGAALTGWQTIDGKDYYFRASGNLETGRFVIGHSGQCRVCSDQSRIRRCCEGIYPVPQAERKNSEI